MWSIWSLTPSAGPRPHIAQKRPFIVKTSACRRGEILAPASAGASALRPSSWYTQSEPIFFVETMKWSRTSRSRRWVWTLALPRTLLARAIHSPIVGKGPFRRS